jgi:hypothetical protein
MAIGKEIFSKILADAERRKMVTRLNRRSLNWFRRKVNSSTRGKEVSIRSLMSQKDDMTSKIMIGRMYHFSYQAKHAKTLPYWDRFPLVIPIETYPDGFLGINMHYLNPRLRARLMDALFTTISDKSLNERAKLRVSYQLLSGASRYRLFEPTVKRYLFSQVRSRYLQIDPKEWSIALFLPTEKFQKKTKKEVWKESSKIISQSRRTQRRQRRRR